jgi:hypothetical protein
MDQRGQSRNAANAYCAVAPSITILDICVRRRGSNTIMMSDSIPMAFEWFGRISVGLRTQKSITAAIVASEIIVGIVDRRMDIEREILK